MSEAARTQRRVAAVRHAAYATASAPQLRQRRLRRKVRWLKERYPHLQAAPDILIQRYAEVDLVAAGVFAALADGQVETPEGQPRRLLTEYRSLIRELGRLAERLGITATPPEPDALSLLLADS